MFKARSIFRVSLALVAAGGIVLSSLLGAAKDSKPGAPTPSAPSAAVEVDPATLAYQMPAKDVADIIDQPLPPAVSISPTREWMAELAYVALPRLADLATPELQLAGVRINPDTNGESRPDYAVGITLRHLDSDKSKGVTGFPRDAHIVETEWSPNGKHMACALHGNKSVELWMVDVPAATAERACGRSLVACLGTPFAWCGNDALICTLVPGNRRKPPDAPAVPFAPVVMEAYGEKNGGVRTYKGLLGSRHDEELFEYYFTSQLARVGVEGSITNIGEPAIFLDMDPSPSSEFVLVSKLGRPWSYSVPLYYFGKKTEVWDKSGKSAFDVAELPLMAGDLMSFDSARPGRRMIGWREDAKATLFWAEAQDGGDPATQAEHRDALFTLAQPFKDVPRELLKTETRIHGVLWGSDDLALVSEGWYKTRKTRTTIVAPGHPDTPARVLFDRCSDDDYTDPGQPVTIRNESGRRVIHTTDKGGRMFLIGKGASSDGLRPFLDSMDVATLEKKRLWQCEGEVFEMPMTFVDAKANVFLTRRESRLDPPNWYRRDLRRKDLLTPLTRFPHPTPGLKDVQKELLRYQRADGVELTATLYTPAGYKKEEQGALPTVVWAYPEEYLSSDTAGQVRTSPWLFPRIHPASPLVWLAKSQGYAVLMGPSMPIIGKNDAEPNDTFISQLVADAEAAVQKVVEMGVADKSKIVIGGQSYGAFMAVNLLAHSDLFVAGMAESGAYNRTLTPFGFQSEQRSLWRAKNTYLEMSPILYADRINEPLLLIHGQADDNPGTHTMQSERLFQAIKGNGGTARLCLFPIEGHGLRARESLMHAAWEMGEWLRKYAPSKANAPKEDGASNPGDPKKSGAEKPR